MTFDLLTFICPSSTQDAERLADLGIPRDRIHAPGNLKYDIQYEPLTPQEIRKLKTTMGIGEIEKILVAGSTHPGEEEILCKALIQIRQRMIHSRLIIVPRHPDRSFQVMKILDKFGLSGTLFDSQTPSVLPDTIDVWIINRMGTLHKMYEIADVAFVGGSLVKNGGHNPLEPAACSKPILFGPDMSDFKDVSKKLIEVQGAVEVKDENSLAQEVLDLFMNRNISENMGRNAYSVYCSGKGTVIRTLKLLERYL
jgi:3-deoxy-D-manno-octulosonic-acid transferase